MELSFRKLLRLLPVFANVACALSHHWLFVVNPHVPFTSRAKPPPAEAQREIEGLVGHQSRRCVLRDHLTHVSRSLKKIVKNINQVKGKAEGYIQTTTSCNLLIEVEAFEALHVVDLERHLSQVRYPVSRQKQLARNLLINKDAWKDSHFQK